jgi:hypothetical protein
MGSRFKVQLDEEGHDYFPVTLTDGVGHEQTKTSLTKLIKVYDLTTIWPTEGIRGGMFYDITKAIEVLDEHLTEEQKIPGVRAQFLNNGNRLEEWQFFGNNYNFTNELGWGQVDSSVLNELSAAVFPLSVTLNISQTLLQTGNVYDINLSWGVFRKGVNVSINAMKYLNDVMTLKVEETVRIQEPSATTLSYKFLATYQGLSDSVTKTIKVVDPSYSGILEPTDGTDTVAIGNAIYAGKLKQTSSLLPSRSYTWSGINLVHQRSCFVYPAAFGKLSSIRDANNFEYLGSYTQTDVVVNGVQYYAYTLTDPVTVTGFKQTFS